MGAKLAALAGTESFGELHCAGMGSRGGAGGGGNERGGVGDSEVAGAQREDWRGGSLSVNKSPNS